MLPILTLKQFDKFILLSARKKEFDNKWCARPRQKSGTAHVLVDLHLSEIQLTEQPLPYRFLRGKREGQIDPVEGHPVDVPFPLLPLPPGETVARGANVLVIPEPEAESRKSYAYFGHRYVSVKFIISVLI